MSYNVYTKKGYSSFFTGDSYRRKRSSSGFNSPASVAGLRLWLDATQGVYADGAIEFDASRSQYLYIADNPSLSCGDTDFSWAGWFWFTENGVEQVLISKYSSTLSEKEFALVLETDNKTIRLTLSNDGWLNTPFVDRISAASSFLNQWVFVAFYHDSVNDKVCFRVNNTTQISDYALGVFNGSLTFRVGAYDSDNRFLNGKADSLGKWSRILTNQELDFLYNNGQGRIYADLTASIKTNLVSWWDLNEYNTTRYDAHGTNNLSEVNAPSFVNGVAYSLAQNTDLISTWNSPLANSAIFSQEVVSARPTYRTGICNNRPSIEFNGIQNFLGFLSNASNATGSAFLVVKSSGLNSGALMVLGASSRQIIQTLSGWESTSPRQALGSISTTGFKDVTGNNIAATFESGTWVLGANDTKATFWSGYIAEVLIYDSNLPSGVAQNIMGYLTTKWGL